MHGRRSCRPELWSLDLKLERTLRRLRTSARIPRLEYSYIEPLEMADPNQDQPQFHEACVICASPAHDLSECPSAS
ncbi:hypothetical protein CsSME_00008602 [Camellia sinensis var. sinensis]